MKTLTLNNSLQIPTIGLGTWKSEKGEAGSAVHEALKAGYTHIDCAPIYKNEPEIGEAFTAAFNSGVISREDLWVTSKLWNNAHAPRHVRPALERTLKDLQLDYLDLFLIHWPVSFRQDIEFPKNVDEFIGPGEIPIIETWGAMEEMVKKGLCKAIGVSNFSLKKLSDLKNQAGIQPVMNQVELHPHLQQAELLSYCRNNAVALTAYSPLGSPDRPAPLKKDREPSLLGHPVVGQIADEIKATQAQVLLCWAIQRGTVAIPKSVSAERLQENLKAAEFVLDRDQMSRITRLDQGYRYIDGSFFCPPGSPYTVAGIWDE